MSDTEPTTRVPDQPCPKCGAADAELRWCGWSRPLQPTNCIGVPEHFHRTCQRCHYDWRTTDVLSTEEPPPGLPWAGAQVRTP